MNDILNKKFKHHKWFLEGVTVAYALDYFAKHGDFYIGKKPARKQSDNLSNDIVYEEVLMYKGDRSTYKLNEVEKNYFLERKEYWDRKRKEESEQWDKFFW